MTGFRRNFLRFLVAALLSFASSATLLAQTPTEAGAELARRVVVRVGPGRNVVLTIRNLSSLKPADVSALFAALENELQSHGIRPSAEPAATTEIVVTISENLRGPLAVAQIRDGESEEVAMVPFAKPAKSPAAAPSLRIERKLVWDQAAAILDFGFTERTAGTISRLVVLGPDQVSLLGRTDSGWRSGASFPIPHRQALSRDARGKLHVEDNLFRTYLERTECAGWDEDPPRLTCSEKEDGAATSLYLTAGSTADVKFVPGRNFFAAYSGGEAAFGRQVQAFFSAAEVYEGVHLWNALAGADGRVKFFDQDGREGEAPTNWGSEIAGIKSECGSGWQVLATRASDASQPDAIQAFEVRSGQLVAAGAPLDVPGPVTALWTTETGRSVHAVVRNLETGRYEAYILTVVCSR